MENKKLIYLDNASTTRPFPEAVESASKYLDKFWGNASSSYDFGQLSKVAIQDSRRIIANTIGAKPEEIIFTSGATESNNTVIQGLVSRATDKIITTPIEHHAILRPLESLRNGLLLPVSKLGRVDPEDVQKAIKACSGASLVSVMAANNEIGTVQPIKEIGEICKMNGVFFHTDATQYYGHQILNVKEMNIDFLSASAHKFGGVKGTGFLYCKNGWYALESMIKGGHQEMNFRAGTENVFGIVAMAEAAKISCERIGEESSRLIELRSYLTKRILNEIDGAYLTGDPVHRLPNNASFVFEGIRGEELVELLNMYGICCSSGSACETGNKEPSHVLKAIGLSDELANGSLRMTLSLDITKEDLDFTVEKLKQSIEMLRT